MIWKKTKQQKRGQKWKYRNHRKPRFHIATEENQNIKGTIKNSILKEVLKLS